MFIKPNQFVIPTEQRDYSEWHRGRTSYALWYLLLDQVKHAEIIKQLDQIRHQFSDCLIKSSNRQYHITLYIGGFLTCDESIYNDDFPQSLFVKQQQQLESLNLSHSITLKLTAVNSFESALFVQVSDSLHQLTSIRSVLRLAQHTEVAAQTYCAHITLGLYAQKVMGQDVLQRLDACAALDVELEFDQIHFGYYSAQTLQGPLHSLYCFNLE